MVIVKTSKVHLWVGEISICMSTDAAYWYFLIQVSVRTLSSHLTWRRTRVFQWLLRWCKSLNCLLGACLLWRSWSMHSCSRRYAAGGLVFRSAKWFRQCTTLHQQMGCESKPRGAFLNPTQCNVCIESSWFNAHGHPLRPSCTCSNCNAMNGVAKHIFFLFDDG